MNKFKVGDKIQFKNWNKFKEDTDFSDSGFRFSEMMNKLHKKLQNEILEVGSVVYDGSTELKNIDHSGYVLSQKRFEKRGILTLNNKFFKMD